MIGRMVAPPALDAPVAGLGDTEALAKEWLLELIASRPLGQAVRVPADRLAALRGVRHSRARAAACAGLPTSRSR